MRITCPYCGTRPLDEYTMVGDATPVRPDPAALNADSSDAEMAFVHYVYARTNPAGPHAELWYHGLGCRQMLVVMRDTTTHEIGWVRPARDCAQERDRRLAATRGSGPA